MSDYDNIREAHFERRQELENEARDAAIDMHAENWMKAVTQSVEKSHGTFKDVTDRTWVGFERVENVRKANSVDVFLEELGNKDFAQRAAQILIELHKIKSTNLIVAALFDDMAANYAEFQYENNIKD